MPDSSKKDTWDNGENKSKSFDLEEDCNTSKCLACHSRRISIALIPCGHAASCVSCAHSLKQCPKCDKKVQSLMKLYFS